MATPACVSSYTTALGYRSRHAAMDGDIEAFEALMTEAAESPPPGMLGDPKRTVLSHFLDLGGNDRFYPMIDAWRQRGWVSDNMTCAIEKARFRGTVEKDRTEAERAADAAIERARQAGTDPERRWEIEACLEQAPFLTRTSTAAIMRFVALAADPTEPITFRAGLLEGLTTMYLQDPKLRQVNDAKVTREEAVQQSRAQLDLLSSRFETIIAAVKNDPDPALIAGATTFGALELERVHLAHGESLIGRYATSTLPADYDLAWAWVRAMKSKKRIPRIEGLGLWDRKREPAGDAYWYLCTDAPKSTGGKRHVAAVSVLAKAPLEDVSTLKTQCAQSSLNVASVAGPFPLEATARGTMTASIAAAHKDVPVEIHISKRIDVKTSRD